MDLVAAQFEDLFFQLTDDHVFVLRLDSRRDRLLNTCYLFAHRIIIIMFKHYGKIDFWTERYAV